MKTKAEAIYVNSILQGCIQEWLDNPPVTTYDALNEAFRRKFNQLEKETQRLLDPVPRKPAKPRKPKAIAPMPVDTERGLTVVPVLDGLQHTSDVRKRGKR
jgi:hypothetical protein